MTSNNSKLYGIFKTGLSKVWYYYNFGFIKPNPDRGIVNQIGLNFIKHAIRLVILNLGIAVLMLFTPSEYSFSDTMIFILAISLTTFITYGIPIGIIYWMGKNGVLMVNNMKLKPVDIAFISSIASLLLTMLGFFIVTMFFTNFIW